MRRTLALAVVPVLICAAVACGGGVSVEDDGAGGDDAVGTSTASSVSGVTTAGPTTTTTTGTSSSSNGGGGPVGTSVVASSGEGGSGGFSITTGEGGFDVGSSGQGGFDVGSSGQGGFDVGSSGQGGEGPVGSSGSGTEPFFCGEQECADGDICCASQQGVTCVGLNDPCQGAVLTCQSAANCDNGQICCLEGGIGDAQSTCADECENGPAGPLQLCESADECPPDVLCQEVFGGFKVCSNGFGG